MYLVLRCDYTKTEELTEWLRDIVGGPDDEFNVSAPNYPSLRKGTTQTANRFLLPGLVFVRDWAREAVCEEWDNAPAGGFRWMYDPKVSELLECKDSSVLELEVFAGRRASACPTERLNWWSYEDDPFILYGPFRGLRVEVVSRHMSGFNQPFYMVKMNRYRSTIKIDSPMLGETFDG